MKMSGHGDMEALELDVRLWLEKNRIPERIYEKLSSYHKDALHKQIYQPTGLVTDRERRDLYRKLCSPAGIAGRNSINPVDYMTDEDLRKFFSPLTPSDWHDYLSKF